MAARAVAVVAGLLSAGCSTLQSALRPPLPVVRSVDPRLEFTAADAAAIDRGSLASARELAARRRVPARDVADYVLEVSLDGEVLSKTIVQIAPLSDGLDLVRHPIPGAKPDEPAQIEASIGVAGAVNVVHWRGVLGVERRKPVLAARLVSIDGEPFGERPSSWTIGIDRRRSATTYKACSAVGVVDASTVHASFAGRAIRYRCVTDELGFVEWLWFIDSLQRYLPGGATVPQEGEVRHRIVAVRYRTEDASR